MKIIIASLTLSLFLVCAASACGSQYKVKAGDTCYQLAVNNKLSLDKFKAINKGINCDNLQIGKVVCVKESSGSSQSTPKSNNIVSFDMFKKAVTSTNNYPTPSQAQYDSFIKYHGSAGGISTKRELAMFLAEIIWESGGLQYKAELACKDTKCPNEYRSNGDDPNKFYYGRGYIQLSWSYNYKAASEALFKDDRLVTNPDQVATNENIAWQTAFWFWKAKVRTDSGVQKGQFGSATNKINGGIECNPCRGNCSKRNDIYANVLKAFGINEAPNFAGC